MAEVSGVKANAQSAPVEEGVKTLDSIALENQDGDLQEVDYEKEFFALTGKLTKIEQDKENYKKGLLKAKGKLPEDDEEVSVDPNDLDTKVNRAVQEALMNTEYEKTRKEQEELVKKALKENRELKVALGNRSDLKNVSLGAGSPASAVDKTPAEKYWSKEQYSYLKSRGLDPEKAMTNDLRRQGKL